ncbi:MAG: PLP-dependent lyase/thiolase [Candidatus Shapirobacteria bacterium]|jgi:threonine dehydratase
MTTTPLIKIDNFYLKREDQNITGSAKDRALVFQVKSLIQQHYQLATISSTGNAALSALHFCRLSNIPLTIYTSPKITPAKHQLIQKNLGSNHLRISRQPISQSIKYAKKTNAYLLRQSTDPSALLGYQSIGTEILSQLPVVSSIFVPVGSGTTLLGISQALPPHIKLYAVQPASCPYFSSHFDSDFIPEAENLTDALGVKYLPQKKDLIKVIDHTGGSGLVVQNDQIHKAATFLTQKQVSTSMEGALALAGLFKAFDHNLPVGQHPVIVLTGTKR